MCQGDSCRTKAEASTAKAHKPIYSKVIQNFRTVKTSGEIAALGWTKSTKKNK
jgi:hypothetical protein